MKLAILDLQKYTIYQQMDKINEEFREWRELPLIYKEENLEECIDMMQAIWGFMQLYATKEEIEEAFDKHVDKLKIRVGTDRGHEILGYIKLSEE
jgi:hypothetical protein